MLDSTALQVATSGVLCGIAFYAGIQAERGRRQREDRRKRFTEGATVWFRDPDQIIRSGTLVRPTPWVFNDWIVKADNGAFYTSDEDRLMLKED